MTADDRRSDAELLEAISAADRGALHELYRRHAPWLVLRLSRRCADPEIVDQAVQDTFVAVWRKPGAWKGSGEVAAWIWGIAIRRLIDQLRRSPARTFPLPAVGETPMGRSAAGRAGADVMASAEEQVLVGVEHGDLAAALDRLSPELRAVVQATVLDGLTTREAGRLLGIPSGTVKTRMLRARTQLREALV